MALTRYKVTVTFSAGEKVTTVVDGRDALGRFLVGSGVRVSGADIAQAATYPVKRLSHFGSIKRVRFVALGWQISGHGGTQAKILGRIAPTPKVLSTPDVFRTSPDSSAKYARNDGSTGRASFWAHAPTSGHVWAVDTAERRYLLLSLSSMKELDR